MNKEEIINAAAQRLGYRDLEHLEMNLDGVPEFNKWWEVIKEYASQAHPSQPSEDFINSQKPIDPEIQKVLNDFPVGTEKPKKDRLGKPSDEEIEKEALKRYPILEDYDEMMIDIIKDKRNDFIEGAKFTQQSSGVNKELLEVIKGAMRIRDLWGVPKDCYEPGHEQYKGEYEALQIMESQFTDLISKLEKK